ncbi:histidine kinase dimerization/phospho-acceptor domain-containing protein [Poseidonocella sp. HB161398]|uniref:histidine kinase dimerization/phospho-acceptor domain-containing protein n=1 Tax=Poseidonocella sp. HB161398 TaxID=2320855 RepID=UPI0011092970|nr:histidine kinase dimerization/phospho-acceptor domain-containing protein [Poseidonocella sp. HB161398]
MNKHSPLSPAPGLLAAAADALELRTRGLRDLAHDLRSPLTALQLGTETLLDGAGDGFERMLLEQMLSDVERLADILRAATPPALCGLPLLLEREMELAAAAARGRGVAVELDLPVLPLDARPFDPPRSAAMARMAWAAAATVGDDARLCLQLDAAGPEIFGEIAISGADEAGKDASAIDSILASGGGWEDGEETGQPGHPADRLYRLRLTQGPDAARRR